MNDNKMKSLGNFKKAVGQLNKIIDMIEKDQYCIDVMQQNLAVIGLLRSAHTLLLEGHLNSCFASGIEAKNSRRKEEIIAEVLKVVKMFNK
ncbi:MAG: metal-sensing transcriptional repressor [Patescibacteria group bacterium]